MKQAVVNIFWLLFDKLLRLSVGLFITMWLARHLGPSQFGELNFVTAFVAIFGVFATLGLKGIVVRDLVNRPSDRDYIMGSAFSLKIIGAILTYLCLIIFIFLFLPNENETKLFVAIVGISILFKTSEIVNFYFEAKVLSKHVVWVENGAFAISSSVKLILLWLQAPLIAFLIAISIEALLIGIALLLLYQRKVSTIFSWKISKKHMSSLLAQSWPLIISSAAWIIYTRIDQIMLGKMLDQQAVGFYSAAVKLTELANILPMIITFSLVPLITPLREKNRALYHRKFQLTYDCAVGLMIAGAILTMFIGSFVVNTLYGSAYAATTPVLVIHVWTCVFIAMATVSGKYLINEGLQKITMQRHVFGVCLNIPLNYLVIPLYGIEGAACASLISLAVSNYFFDALSKNTRICFIQKSKALVLMGFIETVWKRKI
ncbi:flippase [Thalassotalea sp. M1531]|uniref:Flippase n=1 Tax=Thalassotalea algicola TaxID=2716224 RepID=A0A7Y0LAD1_9GAMM|nr:flippase [Thalassotalea algicola]NMP30447.1 flippase [Thalassotalea algicola]